MSKEMTKKEKTVFWIEVIKEVDAPYSANMWNDSHRFHYMAKYLLAQHFIMPGYLYDDVKVTIRLELRGRYSSSMQHVQHPETDEIYSVLKLIPDEYLLSTSW